MGVAKRWRCASMLAATQSHVSAYRRARPVARETYLSKGCGSIVVAVDGEGVRHLLRRRTHTECCFAIKLLRVRKQQIESTDAVRAIRCQQVSRDLAGDQGVWRVLRCWTKERGVAMRRLQGEVAILVVPTARGTTTLRDCHRTGRRGPRKLSSNVTRLPCLPCHMAVPNLDSLTAGRCDSADRVGKWHAAGLGVCRAANETRLRS